MSKIDKLVDSMSRVEEHVISIKERQDIHAGLMEKMSVRVGSLEETRTFAKGMIKLAAVLSVTVPSFSVIFIRMWKFFQAHRLIP